MDYSDVGSSGERDQNQNRPLNQNAILAPEQQEPRHNAGVHVYSGQSSSQPIPGPSNASLSHLSHYQAPAFSGSYTTPQLVLPMTAEPRHQLATTHQFLQMSQPGYDLHSSSSLSYAEHSIGNLGAQNLGFMPTYTMPGGSGQPDFSVNSPIASARQPDSLSLLYVMIKRRRVTAGFSTDQDFSIMDHKLADLLNLDTWPIPPPKQRAILTGVGLVTPVRYTTFTCDIPKLGVSGWITHVQIVDWAWEDPPALRLGRRFIQRLEEESPTVFGLQVHHAQHNARPLTAPPASLTFAHTSGLGSPRSVADGATSTQIAGSSGMQIRSPTIRPNQLVIPASQPGYMSASAALTPGGSSHEWGPNSANSNIFDDNSINMARTGISPATSFQEHTPAVQAQWGSGEDKAWGDFDTTQTQAPVPETGDPFGSADWLFDEDSNAQHQQW